MTTTTNEKHPGGKATVAETMQLVSFRLANETYAVEITSIREIILMCEITKVPQTPQYVKGLINLRSNVIPVVDLRGFFGLPAGEKTEDSRIMVVNVGDRTMGVVVDSVDQVLRVQRDQIAPPPPTIASIDSDQITGLVHLEDQLLILLDIEKILTNEFNTLEQTTAGDGANMKTVH